MTARPLAALFLCLGVAPAVAQEVPKEKPATPPAALVKVGSPVDEAVYGSVQNAALKLQRQAEEAGVRGVLVLELTPGSSRFGIVRDLAVFLTGPELADVRTVAWVPESVDGNNAILALACEEIVMHPDAELGDLGRGRALEKADADYVIGLAEERHNRFVSPALVRGAGGPGAGRVEGDAGWGRRRGDPPRHPRRTEDDPRNGPRRRAGRTDQGGGRPRPLQRGAGAGPGDPRRRHRPDAGGGGGAVRTAHAPHRRRGRGGAAGRLHRSPRGDRADHRRVRQAPDRPQRRGRGEPDRVRADQPRRLAGDGAGPGHADRGSVRPQRAHRRLRPAGGVRNRGDGRAGLRRALHGAGRPHRPGPAR